MKTASEQSKNGGRPAVGKMPFDKLVAFLFGLGVPALGLVAIFFVGRFTGNAIILEYPITLGDELCILGGSALLCVLALMFKHLVEGGIETLLKKDLKRLRETGISKKQILKRISKYPISRDLKVKLQKHQNALIRKGPFSSSSAAITNGNYVEWCID